MDSPVYKYTHITGYLFLISHNTPPLTSMETKLKIDGFRKLYKSLKTPFPPINFLILGMLIGLEQRWIELKAEQAVDEAIADFMIEHPPEVYKAVVKAHEDGSLSIGKAYEDLS